MVNECIGLIWSDRVNSAQLWIAVISGFSLDPDNTIRLTTGAYDHSHPLIIDPVLNYGAAFGGSDGNQALGMDVDSAGNVYLTGNSCSPDFPTTAGNFQN